MLKLEPIRYCGCRQELRGSAKIGSHCMIGGQVGIVRTHYIVMGVRNTKHSRVIGKKYKKTESIQGSPL